MHHIMIPRIWKPILLFYFPGIRLSALCLLGFFPYAAGGTKICSFSPPSLFPYTCEFFQEPVFDASQTVSAGEEEEDEEEG